MTRDEFLSLNRYEVIRRLGVTYKVVDQWKNPGANYGIVELLAYKQKPPYSIEIHPDNVEWLAQAHYVGDSKKEAI